MFRWVLSALVLALVASVSSAAGIRTVGRIAEGTRWESEFHIIEGDEPGPTVVLVGGIHGDEPAGSRAAEQISHWPIRKGRLVVIPRANPVALGAGKRTIPGEPENERDLNRNFPEPGRPNEARGELAGGLWKFIAAQKPDWVIDLHEGFDFHSTEPKSVGSSIIDSNGTDADAMAAVMLAAVNGTIEVPGRKFVNLSVPVSGSLARAAAEHLGAKSMILETTSRGQSLSLRTRQHRMMVRELLLRVGMIAAGDAVGMPLPTDASVPKIAIFDDAGVGDGGPENIEATCREFPGALVWRVGAEDIRDGYLAGFDLVVFPGGSGGSQAQALGEKGRDEVRRFAEGGGGFAGICAGAYLAAANYPWSLAISNHRTFCEVKDLPGKGAKSMWYRGESALVNVELSDAGKRILGDRKDMIAVRYHNGPVMSAADAEDLPDYEVLAWFRSEVSHYEPQIGTMENTPAIIATRFGKGRVLCISPHPEATKGLRPLLASGLRWALRQ